MAVGQKNWLITGVGSGLGKALAAAVLAAGNTVAGTVRSEDAKNAFEADASGRARGFVMDLRDTSGIADTVKAVERLGPIDVLVNNAGHGLAGAVEEASLAEARDQFEVNLFGPLGLIQAVLPGMRARRNGIIVNITSVSGLATWQGTGLYCASKFALEAIGETLADEVAPLGIKVINVEPGGMRTAFSRSLTRARRKIADYATTAHSSEHILAERAGRESGDPGKMAWHILAAVTAESLPRHLLLGADAMHYVTRRMGAMLTEFGQWAPVTLDTQFDE
ncbi:MAG TPA: oxidoreductase [Rhizomicrobium sp.]|nr:oxidoreductase [Rhizomicrobium sp.]